MVSVKPEIVTVELLFDHTQSVVFSMIRGTYDFVVSKLKQHYPNINIVSNQIFLCELDHISLFDCRSDCQLWTYTTDIKTSQLSNKNTQA
jgi:hypothetical protein